ncbi:asparaginase [Leucobacter chinensis]|uniref:asparaginase n=1 Tax=Leucobacter chinensis TaxID=2851010 RepID=UPI001C212140|nr:asparaginase [Leucobacter chinensis]
MTKPLETASFAESAELAVVTRGDFIESRHAGSAVVLSPEGETLVAMGAPETPFFTRSALKPLQSLAMHSVGLSLASDEERALSLASHDGFKRHAEVVWRMLSAGGLSDKALLCPPSWPSNAAEARAHASRGGSRERMLHCCSGKHAAMLRTCQVNGWDLGTYLSPTHPLQTTIKETVQRFTGEVPYVAVDGCGAPTHAVSLTGFARAMRRMATSEPQSPFPLHRHAYELLRSARAEGWAVCGPGTNDTTLIDRLGVFSKLGAEGSVVVITPSGYVAVVKTLDGSQRPLHLVAGELLTRVGAISQEAFEAVKPELHLRVSGGGAPVGEIRVAF